LGKRWLSSVQGQPRLPGGGAGNSFNVGQSIWLFLVLDWGEPQNSSLFIKNKLFFHEISDFR
jgi:hypothetical protein